VIDGIPMYNSNFGNDTESALSIQPGTEGVADINPEDIESISLLTGPSAAALYGYEGANGVVLIVTKKGQSDKTNISVYNTTTFSKPLMLPKFQNKYGNEKGKIESWGDETSYRYDPSTFFNTGCDIISGVSIHTGGTYMSAASTNSDGILPNNLYNRYNITFNNTTSFFDDKMMLSVGGNYIIQKNKNMVSQGQYFNPLPAIYLFPRGENFNEIKNYERYDELADINVQYWPYGEGDLTLQNPYWTMYRMNREMNRKRYILSANLKYNITEWLNVEGRVHSDYSDFLNTEKRYAGTTATFAGTKGYFCFETRYEHQIYSDLIANAIVNTGNFSHHVNIGASIKDISMKNHHILGNLDKITNWFTTENISRTDGLKIKDYGLRHQTQSIFANAETGFKNMAFLTLTGRMDWDSALAFSENGVKPFFYPSVGLAGIISEMLPFPEWFSYMKTRVSFTSVSSAYEPYLTRERYAYNEQTNQYSTISLYPNRNLKPELTKSLEAGLNMRFFNGAIRFDATWYRSNTFNQMFIATLPASSPYSGVYVQSGNVQNTGVEMELDLNLKSGNFVWNTEFTYSFNKNTIIKLADGIKNPVSGETISMPYKETAQLGNTSPYVRLMEGGSMGDLYVKEIHKRDSKGRIYFDPETHNPIEDLKYVKAGSILPKSYAGWGNSFSYKQMTLNILFSGRFGGEVVSNTQAILDRYGVSEYSAKLREQGMVTVADNIQVTAKKYLEIIAAGTGEGAHYIYSANNIRLKELSIYYTIPRSLTGNIVDVTIGLIGSNLAMLYCKAPFDPELTASPSSTYYTGVDYFMQPSVRSIGGRVKFDF